MTVPSRHVWRAFAEHSLRFHHEIFKNLVERGAHVHISVGERWSVMEYKQLAALSRFLYLPIEPGLLPLSEHFRFARGEVRLHRKLRARQIKSIFVVLAHGRPATLTFVNWQSNVAGIT